MEDWRGWNFVIRTTTKPSKLENKKNDILFDKSEFLDVDKPGKFSIVKDIAKYKCGDYFVFKMVWPHEGRMSMEWKQEQDPTTINYSQLDQTKVVHIDVDKDFRFVGLHIIHNSPTFLKGSSGITWYFAIGATSFHRGGIPRILSSSKGGTNTLSVYLYIHPCLSFGIPCAWSKRDTLYQEMNYKAPEIKFNPFTTELLP